MSIYFVIFLFLRILCTRNLSKCEGKLLRVRLIMKKLRNFNFFIKEINKYIHKDLQEKKCMCNMSYFNLMYLTSFLYFVQEIIFIVTKNKSHFD